MAFYLDLVGPREVAALRGDAQFRRQKGDLYAPLRGTQELLLHGRNPYRPDVTRDIQIGYYGKPIEELNGKERDQQRFAYPVYVTFFLAPAVHLAFPAARTIFWWLLLAITIASVPLWLLLTGVRVHRLEVAGLAAMAAASITVVQGLNLQQLALLVAGLLAASAALLVREKYFWAGLVLALASIKPQMSALITVWLVAWAAVEWRKRRGLVGGLALTGTFLLAASQALLPGWIWDFLRGLAAYTEYTESAYLLKRLFEGVFGPLAAAATIAFTLLVCWRTRHAAVGSVAFAFTYCLVLTVTVLVMPTMSAVYCQILLLPALLLLAHHWREILFGRVPARVAAILMATTVIAPWVLATFIVPLWIALPHLRIPKLWLLPLYVNALLAPATFGLLVLLAKRLPWDSPSHD
jgi:Glycosyltransferase family 87